MRNDFKEQIGVAFFDAENHLNQALANMTQFEEKIDYMEEYCKDKSQLEDFLCKAKYLKEILGLFKENMSTLN